MERIIDPSGMATWSARRRLEGQRIGFVPTMGALHAGHLELLHRARQEFDAVVMSIFVNPLQFNDPRDFEAYPHRPEADARLAREAGCDALFLPERATLFADFDPVHYDLGGLDEYWEGPSRPGHFQGVVNVVERLFHYVRPDGACFGEKDRQQLAIIQWVAARLRWPTAIVPCPTVREADGLAMSSRNLRLSAEQRSRAPALYQALLAVARKAFRAPVGTCLSEGRSVLERHGITEVDYLGAADALNLRPLTQWPSSGEAVVLVAARLGDVRLIDNMTLPRP